MTSYIPTGPAEISVPYPQPFQPDQRRHAWRLMRQLMTVIERIPEEDRGNGLEDAYQLLEKVITCKRY
jgi:hypothetical protein